VVDDRQVALFGERRDQPDAFVDGAGGIHCRQLERDPTGFNTAQI